MTCRYCGWMLREDAPFCSQCGKSLHVRNEKSAAHWIPVIMNIISFFIFFLILGGDAFIYEVNVFDWAALFTSLAALVLSFILVPKERVALRATSATISAVVAFMAFNWIAAYGF